ncbi:DHH family phosphoesterase [bacterium]|nr:DHH family phosphoesterase [bacterium]
MKSVIPIFIIFLIVSIIKAMDKKHKQFKKYIEKASSILIVSHRGPDMDAFCSMLLVKEFLNIYYPKKKVTIKAKRSPSFNIPRMHDINVVKRIDEGDEDLIIITDMSGLEFVCDSMDSLINSEKDVVVIDHHQQISKDHNLVINEHMSSATEQVIETFKQILGKKFKLTNEIAALGQYGINADTGRFLYETTTSNTFRLFADLFELNPIDLEEIAYKNNKVPRGSSSVIAHLLEEIVIEGDMAYTYVSLEDMESHNWKDSDVGEAINFIKNNYLRFIQGVHWGFLLKPSLKEEGVWWLSLRGTKSYQEVDGIAEALGGGGHKFASGARLEYSKGTSVEKVLEDVLGTIKEVTEK